MEINFTDSTPERGRKRGLSHNLTTYVKLSTSRDETAGEVFLYNAVAQWLISINIEAERLL